MTSPVARADLLDRKGPSPETPELQVPGGLRRRLADFGARHLPAGLAPRPTRIVLMLTHRCNQRCAVCAQWGDHGVKKAFSGERLRDELALSDYEALLDELARHRPLVLLSGGEITIYKDWVQVVEAVKRRGLFAEIYTNGMNLAAAADRLVAMGLYHVKISIDGPQPVHDELRGVRGAFRRAAEGARALVAARARRGAKAPFIEVACVLSERNLEHARELLGEVEGWGVDGIDFTHRNFLSSAKITEHLRRFEQDFGVRHDDCWAGLRCDDPIQYVERCVSLVHDLRRRDTRLRLNFFPDFSDDDIRGFYGDPDYRPAATEPSCLAPWLNAIVEPDGEVTVCPNYSIGNVRESGFHALWNNERARAIRTNLKTKGLFAGCTKCCWYYVY